MKIATSGLRSSGNSNSVAVTIPTSIVKAGFTGKPGDTLMFKLDTEKPDRLLLMVLKE